MILFFGFGLLRGAWVCVSVDRRLGRGTSFGIERGGTAFSNMAVGYNNVDVNAADKYGVSVGNTPVSSVLVCFYVLCLCHACFFVRMLYMYTWCMCS